MAKVDKITVFDNCVDGKLENFNQLINPFFNQFNKFHKLYKDTFVDGKEPSQIIFNKNNDDTVTFLVKHSNDIVVLGSNDIMVSKTTEGHSFCVQSNKKQN